MTINYERAKAKVEQVLRQAYGSGTYVATGRGYQGRVQVKVISKEFNGKSEREKQDMVWNLLHEKLKDESQGISFVLAYGTDEPDDQSFEEAHQSEDTRVA